MTKLWFQLRGEHMNRIEAISDVAFGWCAKSLFYAREFRRFVMVQQYVFTNEEVREAVRQATETQSA